MSRSASATGSSQHGHSHWAETAAPRVAFVAALLGFAARAGVDGVGAGDDGLDGRGVGATPQVASDAQLVVSELTTNAVVHAKSARTVIASFDDSRLRIEVHDHDPAPPRLRDRPDADGVWGLRIVASAKRRSRMPCDVRRGVRVCALLSACGRR